MFFINVDPERHYVSMCKPTINGNVQCLFCMLTRGCPACQICFPSQFLGGMIRSRTALHIAVWSGSLHIVDLLLHCSDVNGAAGM